MKRVNKIIAGAAGALALVAATAFAAAPDGTFGPCGASGAAGYGPMGMMYGGTGPSSHGAMGPGARGGMWGGGFGFMSEQRLANLKTELKITTQQEPAWKAFAAKVAEQASQMQAMRAQRGQAPGTDATAPANMASHIGWMTQRLAGMQAMNTSLTDLYAVLTPEQRSVADQSFGPMGPHGYGPGMGRQTQ